jgi:tetratricopeptide (TPR) repeat protein
MMIMRTAAIVALSVTTLVSQTIPSPTAIYRAALAEYLKTGDAARAAQPLATLGPEQLELAVKAILFRADPRELEGAADLHLEIGIAVAGLPVSGAAAYFDQGSRLANAIVPPPAIRKGVSALRLEQMTLISTTWHRVAASTFLSINDVARARSLIQRAPSLEPKSAEMLTVLGTASEIDAGALNPDNVDSLTGKTHSGFERSRRLMLAENSYKAALDSDPTYPLALIRLGRVQFLQNNVKSARESLERGAALAREPRHQFLAAMFMGALQESRNDLAGANQSYERALRIVPQSQHAVAAVVFVDGMLGWNHRAEEVARAYTSAKLDEAWWLHKTGAFDVEGLHWLRQHLRQ